MYCFLWFVWTSQTDTLPGFKLRGLFTILFEKWIRWLITISNSSATFVKRKEKFHLNGEAHWDRNYTPWQPAAWSPCFGSCAILPRPTALPDLAPQPNSLGLIKAIFLLKTVTLGHVWMKAPIRIQVPRLCPSASLWNGLFLQNRSNPILVPFNLKTLFSSLRGRSSWQPQNFSRVNQQLSSLKPWPPSCTAGDRGALGSLDLPRERATSVTVLKAESCAQELPELKVVSSSGWSTFVKFFPRAMCHWHEIANFLLPVSFLFSCSQQAFPTSQSYSVEGFSFQDQTDSVTGAPADSCNL